MQIPPLVTILGPKRTPMTMLDIIATLVTIIPTLITLSPPLITIITIMVMGPLIIYTLQQPAMRGNQWGRQTRRARRAQNIQTFRLPVLSMKRYTMTLPI